MKRALELRLQLLGQDHADVAQSLLDLAWNQCEREDGTGGEGLCRRALAIHRKLGLRNKATLEILNVLHHSLVMQHKYDDADNVTLEAKALAAELSTPKPRWQ